MTGAAGSNSSGALPSYQAIADDLASLGVDSVFGLMGDDTAKLISALRDVNITYYGVRHENAAVAMADGYSAATGQLGVSVISRGPGLTNGLSAAVSSAKAHSRVLIILGEVPTQLNPNRTTGPEYKAFGGSAVSVASGLMTFVPQSTSALRIALRDAAATALRGNTVTLAVPVDLVDAHVTPSAETVVPSLEREPPRAAEPEAIALVISLLANSRRPVILAGNGAHLSGARDPLMAFADRIGAVLGTSLRAKDLFRGHAFNIGIVGSLAHGISRDLVSQADLILVFGASLTQFTTGWGRSFAGTPIVHVDAVRSNIGRYCRADVAVVGDASVVCKQLLDATSDETLEKPFRSSEIEERLAKYSPSDEFAPVSTEWTVDPRSLILELERLLPEDRAIVCDLGNFFGFVPPYLSVSDPSRFHYRFDFASIGIGFGLALGVAVAKPQRPTVLFIGDGALLMSLGEIETVARCGIPLVMVTMNDASYGAERHILELAGLSYASAIFPDADFAAVAEAFGVDSATIRSVNDLRALGSTLSNPQGPLLLDCKVTPTVRDPTFDEQFLALSEEHEPSSDGILHTLAAQ
jgi:acetolactate synthase-1/2/3 large subunit